ncbi:hypothetical protein [Solibacillus sp. FSL K6-1523]|uniref:hypothetical protein n=1 Tax=Solibacillus sp. FSL K6-1523 TaxID=2921471 RepID=UPI0030F758DC
MEQFTIMKHLVTIDAEKTKELYDSLPLVSEKEHCGCDNCCYYAEAIIEMPLQIQQFFQKFGIDPRKKGEIWKAAEYDAGTCLYIVNYRCIGNIQGANQLGWIEIDDAKFSLTNYPTAIEKVIGH